MFISASRRTDIPSHYSEWFMNRIRAGFVLVRNPVNPRQVSRVSLSQDVVDGIVFWTKNPIPMLGRLDGLRGYMYCFQFTLNAYGAEAERRIPSKNAQLVDAFRRLSDKIGSERVLWRYDPIFVSGKYTVEYHLRYFEALARRLAGYTEQCTMSFLDVYGNTARNMAPLHARTPSEQERAVLAAGLAEIAAGYGLRLRSCAEPDSMRRYGIEPASCVDARLFEKLLGCRLDAGRDAAQRPHCGCAGSVDCQKRLSTAFFDNKVPRPRAADGDQHCALRLGCPPKADNSTLASREVFSATYTPPPKMIAVPFAPIGRETLRGFFDKLIAPAIRPGRLAYSLFTSSR